MKLLTLLLSVCTFCAFAQGLPSEKDLGIETLQGKVKTLKEYTQPLRLPGMPAPSDTSFSLSREISFDKNKAITSIVSRSAIGTKVSLTKQVFKYNKANQLINVVFVDAEDEDKIYQEVSYTYDKNEKEETWYNAQKEVIRKLRYQYDVAGNERAVYTYNAAGEITKKVEITYNDQQKPIEKLSYGKEEVLLQKDSIAYNADTTTTFITFVKLDPKNNGSLQTVVDRFGNMMSYAVSSPEGDIISQIIYQYDKAGNWIKMTNRTRLPDQKESESVTKREITYYD